MYLFVGLAMLNIGFYLGKSFDYVLMMSHLRPPTYKTHEAYLNPSVCDFDNTLLAYF